VLRFGDSLSGWDSISSARRLLVAALTLLSGGAYAQTVTCSISTKFICESDAGCMQVEPGVWSTIDYSDQTYSRCDRRGCDKYNARFHRRAGFVVIEIPGRGITGTFSVDTSVFLEVATTGTTAIVSFGTCQ
jgi:hypothetical protein